MAPIGTANASRSWVFRTVLAGVVLLALALRLYGLSDESLWLDELATVRTYSLPLKPLIVQSAEVGQPPFDNLIGAALDRAGLADSDWWVRFPSALFGTGCVFAVGLWMAEVAGAVVGITSALVLAVCPIHVYLSQEARPYMSFFFFALAESGWAGFDSCAFWFFGLLFSQV